MFRRGGRPWRLRAAAAAANLRHLRLHVHVRAGGAGEGAHSGPDLARMGELESLDCAAWTMIRKPSWLASFTMSSYHHAVLFIMRSAGM